MRSFTERESAAIRPDLFVFGHFLLSVRKRRTHTSLAWPSGRAYTQPYVRRRAGVLSSARIHQTLIRRSRFDSRACGAS